MTFSDPSLAQDFLENMSISCSQIVALNLPLLMPWKRLLAAQDEPGSSPVTLYSPDRKDLENKHVRLRYILPKGTDLRALGVIGQSALNLTLSHVNSAPVEMVGGRSPLGLADFIYHDLYEKLEAFGIHKIEKDKVILKPYLPKK